MARTLRIFFVLTALAGLLPAALCAESLGAEGLGNERIRDFRVAKKIAARIHSARSLTLYCRCKYEGKRIDGASCGYVSTGNPRRAVRLEWEHVVPAEAFGQSFIEWREGGPRCQTRKKKYRGRRCAEKNPEFARMEADLYNLFPEVGEVNGLRSNYSMAEISPLGRFAGTSFGECRARIFESKFEPMDFAKGTVARAYLYMDYAYPGHGVISAKNRKLFEAWDRLHPVESWECELYREIKRAQGNENPILAARCGALGL
jgi:deoxyribonuclease-1